MSLAHQRLVESGPAVFVGSVGEGLRPSCVRGYGASVTHEGRRLRVLLRAEQSARVLADLAHNPRVAVTLSMPSTFRSLQIKGEVLSRQAPSAFDREVGAVWREAFIEEATSVGFPREGVQRMRSEPTVVLEVAVTALFDQTPGPGAGRAVTE